MQYHFRNLVFEGGGVRGLAYIGAMEELEKRHIVQDIIRVGGTSVGAINATMLALGYTLDEQREELWKLDFSNFQDYNFTFVPNLFTLFTQYGWYAGSFAKKWVARLVKRKLGKEDANFLDLMKSGKRALYVYGTNLCTHFGQIFSPEQKAETPIAEAVRISMSIPLFFAARRSADDDVYVDGGCLNNYPVKLFDREKYLDKKSLPVMGGRTKYYTDINKTFIPKHRSSSPYIFNRETLGFRLDTRNEIAAFRYNEPHVNEIHNIVAYGKQLIKTMLDIQNNIHLNSDDWERTIYIDTKDIGTTEFGITEERKKILVEAGRQGTLEYFKWYDNPKTKAANQPAYTRGWKGMRLK
jgi:NTE family protein